MYKYLLPLGFVAIIVYAFYDALLTGLIIAGWTVLAFGVCAGAMTLYIGFQRAKREGIITKMAGIQTVQDGYGMLHLIDFGSGHSQNLTLDPRAYRNGHYEEPTNTERETLKMILASKHAGTAKQMIIEQPALLAPVAQQLDLLTIFTQATQSYAIIGGQQVGKTFQARRIARYWLQSGIKPIVIGPKWDRGEWDGCALFGGEYNFDRVSQGMRIIKKLAEDRHGNSRMGHKEHPVQPVFFDDWTAIRAKIENEAEDFIIDATTLYASVNVILYFIIHLDTANAWGVGKVGAALHQNFIKLFVEPGFNEVGIIDRSRTTGYLLMPGQSKKDRRQVQLFNGTGQLVALPDLVQRLTPEESKVAALISEGASRSRIAREVFGSDGGNQLKAVDKIMAKLNP